MERNQVTAKVMDYARGNPNPLKTNAAETYQLYHALLSNGEAVTWHGSVSLLDKTSHIQRHLFGFEPRNNIGDKQRGVLGSSSLEEADVVLGLGSGVVTEAA